jgi:hypothetical protein
MLSLESIEKRLENPKAYYVFYQFFYKAAVGEVRWKECMNSIETRIGNDTTEAFALLLFANNYKAWLYEEKLNHGEALWTEYDSLPASVRRESIVDRLLLDQEFVLEKDTEEFVVRDPTKPTYKKAAKARKDWLAALKRLPICAEMRNTWQQTARAEEVNENEPNSNAEPTNSKKERNKKRRKLMQGLKKWTGPADEGERKFKGWSDNGHKAFEQSTMDIKNDVQRGMYALWETAFREVHNEQQEARKSEEETVEKFVVDKSVVWEL